MAMRRVEACGKRGLGVFQGDVGAALCVHVSGSFHTPKSSHPRSRGHDPVMPFVESTEPNWPEMDVPFAVVDRFEPDVFANENGADGDISRVPRHVARRANAADFVMRRIFDGGQATRQRARRRRVETAGRLLPERLVGSYLVVATTKSVKPTLLRAQIGGR